MPEQKEEGVWAVLGGNGDGVTTLIQPQRHHIALLSQFRYTAFGAEYNTHSSPSAG